ncbi:MAG: hypothetical protein U1E59_12065 [Amaricoccus sp.]
MPAVLASILETIGETPVMRLAALAPEGAEIDAKLEDFDPTGSVKDRLALGFIEATSAPAVPPEPAPQRARDFLTQAVGDRARPVALFALEWCEFSWPSATSSATSACPYRSVGLDAMQDGLGGGIHVGGSTDALDRGDLEPLLRQAGVAPAAGSVASARNYLPEWVAGRPAA